MTHYTSADTLSEGGPLSGRLPGFVARPTQQDMAARIEQVSDLQLLESTGIYQHFALAPRASDAPTIEA